MLGHAVVEATCTFCRKIDTLKWYYDQIFTPCNFRRFKEYLMKDLKCHLPFSNTYFSSRDIYA